MPAEITMPQLSDTMTEGTLVKWLKKEGDKVKAGETIAEVETDKAVMSMEAFEGGTIALIDVREGGKVPVGGRIAVLATGKENPADVKKAAGESASKSASLQGASQPQTTSTATTVSPESPKPSIVEAVHGELRKDDGLHGATREVIVKKAVSLEETSDGRLKVSPLARRIAKENGVDLSSIKGSGPGGRIVQADVLGASEGGAKSQSTPASASAPTAAGAAKSAPVALAPARVGSGEKQVIPLTKMRSVIAQRLQQSKQQIPHFYEAVDVDMEALSELRERVNKQLEAEKIRISIADFIAKAVATALQRNPAINAHFSGDSITRFGDVHLGMAVALPDGLIVPVLRNIHQMGLKEIRARSADLIDRARAQKLKQEEMSGATFTVSNLGTMGVKHFSAIINPPEVGILAIAAAEKRAVVRDGKIEARLTMTITLSADHRAVDGAVAAEFLRTLKSLLEEPGMMLV